MQNYPVGKELNISNPDAEKCGTALFAIELLKPYSTTKFIGNAPYYNELQTILM